MINTGIYADNQEIEEIRQIVSRAQLLGMQAARIGPMPCDEMLHSARVRVHELAMCHGLAETEGYYGMDADGQFVRTPNDPKLSHGRAWRAGCGGGKVAAVLITACVTCAPVGCSAWLGVADVGSCDGGKKCSDSGMTLGKIGHGSVGIRSVTKWVGALECSPCAVEIGSPERENEGAITVKGGNGLVHVDAPRVCSVVMRIATVAALAMLDVNAQSNDDAAKLMPGDLGSLPNHVTPGSPTSENSADDADKKVGREFGWHTCGWLFLLMVGGIGLIEIVFYWAMGRSADKMCRFLLKNAAAPNDPKLSDRSPEARS